MKFTPTRFQFLSTIDVDSAFAYKNKGLYRTLGGISKDVFSLRIGNLRRRLSFILNSERDPFDTFHLLETLHEQYKVQGVFFFLLADFGKYDKNVSHRGEALRHRIAHIALGNQVGIHPGVASNQSRDRLKLECERLAEITGRPATRSRQHYLVMSFPSTYRNLIEMGIADDYTMGFAGDTGFRAGTSNAFQWYDLERETATPLMVHPFAVMDATLRFYLSLDPDQAIQRMSELLDQVRKVNGTFCTLWHNESLSELPPWQGWRRVFEEILKKA